MLMPFGKHKGKDLEDIDTAYLEWLAGDLDNKSKDGRYDNTELIAALSEELKFRKKHGDRVM